MKLRLAYAAPIVGAIFVLVATGAEADGIYGGGLEHAQLKRFSWTGLYVGALASRGWENTRHCDNQICAQGWPNFEVSGWLGGLTAGYNLQMGSLVAGVEGDWSWADISESVPNTGNFGCGGSCTTDLESIGTVRARLGYAHERLLLYVTAGAAFTEFRAAIGNPIRSEESTTRTRYAVGGGVEYAFTSRVSAKAEYIYIDDLDDLVYDNTSFCGGAPNNCFVRMGHIDLARFGVNYRF